MEENPVLEVLNDVERRMLLSSDRFGSDIDSIRGGRANVSILDGINIDYYGTSMPVNQIATVAAPDPRLITIQPWDKGALATIERELLKSDLGLTPNNDGQIIRLPIPPMTQERRQEMVKRLHRLREDTHIAIRNVRRDGLEQLRQAEKDKRISQDELFKAQEQLQQATDKHVGLTDRVSAKKEAELLEV